ncbi:hypothetical protein JXB01_03025 [Candidatus Micrarchaeota archaeon]|nr:hypothetical protein [Candidatus Micrarchaeota archaeon]
MSRGQITIEFLFSFLFYLSFIAVAVTALNAYHSSADMKSDSLVYLSEMEGSARMLDTFLIISRHNSISLGLEMQYSDGLMYSEQKPGIFLEVLDYEKGMESEPV